MNEMCDKQVYNIEKKFYIFLGWSHFWKLKNQVATNHIIIDKKNLAGLC